MAAQERSHLFSGKTGFGYFTDLFGIFEKNLGAKPGSEPGQPGNMFWGEAVMHLNKKTSIGFLFGRGQVGFTHHPFADEPTKLFRVDDYYQIVGVHFYKCFNFRKSNIALGAGPQYISAKSPQLIFGKEMLTNGTEVEEVYTYVSLNNRLDEMIGLAIDLDFSYPVYKNLFIGAKVNTSFMLDFGIEGLLLSPYLKIGL